MTDEQAAAVVTEALVAVLELDPASVDPDATWDQVGADSLALMEVVEITEARAKTLVGPAFRITDPEIDDLPTPRALAERLVRG